MSKDWFAQSLYSGSSGNSYVVRSGSTTLLIDLGVTLKRMDQALLGVGIDPHCIDALLITHEHADHIRGVGPFCRKYGVPIYTSPKTWEAMKPMLGNLNRLTHCPLNGVVDLGDVRIYPFSISHDAVDPLGYRIETERRQVAFCTDLGVMTSAVLGELQSAHVVYLEANYDDHLLQVGHYPWALKQRIRSAQGHLSNTDAAKAAKTLFEAGVSHVVLSHLSAHNNYPELAALTVSRYIGAQGMAVTAQDLYVAERHAPGKRYHL